MNTFPKRFYKGILTVLLAVLLAGNATGYIRYLADIPDDIREQLPRIIAQAMKYSKIVEGKTTAVILSAVPVGETSSRVTYEIKFYLLVDEDRIFYTMTVPIEKGGQVSPWWIAGAAFVGFMTGYLLAK